MNLTNKFETSNQMNVFTEFSVEFTCRIHIFLPLYSIILYCVGRPLGKKDLVGLSFLTQSHQVFFFREDTRKRPGGIVLRMTWKV